MRVLDFQYEISKDLYSLYVFAKEEMAKAIIRKGTKELDAQQVYAGMTYGKNNLTETYQEPASRGFFA